MALIREMILPANRYIDTTAAFLPSSRLVNSSLFYGVELELENCKYTLPSSGGTNVVGSQAIQHGIVAHHDGSLRNGGIELVTKPVRGRDLVTQVKYICDIATSNEWTPSNRAGLHVHVDVQGLTHKQYVNLIKAYVLAEPCFFKAISNERRGSIYCKAWYQGIDAAHVRNTTESLERGLWMHLPSRYLGLNINSTGKYGTLEFRHKNSTTDADDILEWINIIGRWYNYSMSVDITPELVKSMTPESLVYSMFGDLDLMDHEFPSYFYHGCVPLWFDIFGPPATSKLEWERKKITAHKGYRSFRERTKVEPPTLRRMSGATMVGGTIPSPDYIHSFESMLGQSPPITAAYQEGLPPNVPDHLDHPSSYFHGELLQRIYFNVPPIKVSRRLPSGAPSTHNLFGRIWVLASLTRRDLLATESIQSERDMGAGIVVYTYALP